MVSQQIKAIERDLTCRVVARSAHRLRALTPIVASDAAAWLKRFLADRHSS